MSSDKNTDQVPEETPASGENICRRCKGTAGWKAASAQNARVLARSTFRSAEPGEASQQSALERFRSGDALAAGDAVNFAIDEACF